MNLEPGVEESVGEEARRAEEVWVRAAQEGDLSAFEHLYRQHVGRIHALCLRMSGDRREAEDLTQTAFVRAFEKLGSFRGRSAFGTWLHRLTVNTVLDGWRRGRREREHVAALGPGMGESRLALRSSRGLAMDLERAIAALPKGARTLFVLHDVEGYKHREIAEMTGLALGTCKAQLHRARRLLREALK